MVDDGKLYGKSLAFPPRVGANGQLVWSQGELNVRESICVILRTRPGERVNLPDFGCGLERFLFEPNTTSTLRLIQEEVKRALSRWEPRVRLDDILVESDPAEPRAVNITIFYTLIATRQRERVGLSLALQG
jgi:phage baseplate assembly protein W